MAQGIYFGNFSKISFSNLFFNYNLKAVKGSATLAQHYFKPALVECIVSERGLKLVIMVIAPTR